MKLRSSALILAALCCLRDWSAGVEPTDKPVPTPKCSDAIVGHMVVAPTLDSAFFRSTTSSYPWHIVEHEDGTLEDTFGGSVSKTSVKKLGHTADCVSSHQGKHAMSFCDAETKQGRLTLTISGGMPAYVSSLVIFIDGERFTCDFSAVYPGPAEGLGWRITKKELRVKSSKIEAGSRFYAWLSIKFEESRLVDGKIVWRPHKIEGFIKPQIQQAVK